MQEDLPGVGYWTQWGGFSPLQFLENFPSTRVMTIPYRSHLVVYIVGREPYLKSSRMSTR